MADRQPINGKTRTLFPAVLLLALVSALLYANTLKNSFQYDDTFYILKNDYVHDLSGIRHFFTSSRFVSNLSLTGYRPLTMTTFTLNYVAGGDDPTGYHLVNITIHIVNSLLVLAVSLALIRTFESPRANGIAFLVALLFAIHPINTQPVNYVSGRSTLLVAGFSLLCVLLYIRARTVPGTAARCAHLIGSLIAYLCALLSKEEAVAVPGLLIAYELCSTRLRFDGERMRKAAFALLPFLAMTALFLVWVVQVLGIIGETHQPRDTGENLLTQARVFFFYLKMIAIPTDLSIDHVLASSKSILEPAALVSVLGIAGLVFLSVCLVRVVPWFSFGLWWFLATLVPSSTLVALKLILNEQRLYLPGMGIMFVAAMTLNESLQRWNDRARQRARLGVFFGLVTILVALSTLTIRRNTQWRDPKSLWSSALGKYPASMRANTQLASVYLREDRIEDALDAAMTAVQLAPDVVETRTVLARAYSRAGRNEEALAEARTAVDLNPGSAEAHAVLGLIYARLGRYKEAESAWERAIEIDPQNADALENLELLRLKLQRNH